MKPTYSLPLADYPYILVRLSCWDCPRRAHYRLAHLAAVFGADVTIFSVLEGLAGDCERWYDMSPFEGKFCGAHFPDLYSKHPPGLPPGDAFLCVIEGSREPDG